jgi:DNA-binding CsgD family transcriptional regulator
MKAVKAVVMLLMLALSVPALAQDSLGQNKQQVNSLTSRERQIVLMVAEGLTNKDVGRRLNLSEGTVHLHNIYTKLGINKQTALVPTAHAHREELMGRQSSWQAVARTANGKLLSVGTLGKSPDATPHVMPRRL